MPPICDLFCLQFCLASHLFPLLFWLVMLPFPNSTQKSLQLFSSGHIEIYEWKIGISITDIIWNEFSFAVSIILGKFASIACYLCFWPLACVQLFVVRSLFSFQLSFDKLFFTLLVYYFLSSGWNHKIVQFSMSGKNQKVNKWYTLYQW